MENIQLNAEANSLVDRAEEAILNYIKERNLKPGDKLLHEEDLSLQLGVARNVVREALSRLRSFGILDSRKRRGIILQEPDIKKNLEKIINPNMLGTETFNDLLELRYMLELGIVSLLIKKITDHDIEDLENLLGMSSITDGVRVPIEDELRFHSRIYRIVDNQILMDLQQLLIPMYRFIHDNYEAFDIYNQTIKENKLQATHYDIIQCLKKRDKSLYEEIIKRHLMAYRMYINEHKTNGKEKI